LMFRVNRPFGQRYLLRWAWCRPTSSSRTRTGSSASPTTPSAGSRRGPGRPTRPDRRAGIPSGLRAAGARRSRRAGWGPSRRRAGRGSAPWGRVPRCSSLPGRRRRWLGRSGSRSRWWWPGIPGGGVNVMIAVFGKFGRFFWRKKLRFLKCAAHCFYLGSESRSWVTTPALYVFTTQQTAQCLKTHCLHTTTPIAKHIYRSQMVNFCETCFQRDRLFSTERLFLDLASSNYIFSSKNLTRYTRVENIAIFSISVSFFRQYLCVEICLFM
jgi:hypothetical protein